MASDLSLTSRRAQQVEAVLRKHQVYTGCDLKCCPESRVYPKLVADLLTILQPTPSREALENLDIVLERRVEDYPVHSPYKLTKATYDRIYAWATGKAGRPTWCSHWHWEGSGLVAGWKRTQTNTWLTDEADWDICPVSGCHAPRPGAG